MLYTKNQLCTEVLKRAQITGSADTPASEDLARVVAIYDTKLHEWMDRDLVYWTNTNGTTAEIPAPVFEPLVALLINAAERQFGKNAQISLLDRQAIEDMLLKRLRRHTRMQSANMPHYGEYI